MISSGGRYLFLRSEFTSVRTALDSMTWMDYYLSRNLCYD